MTYRPSVADRILSGDLKTHLLRIADMEIPKDLQAVYFQRTIEESKRVDASNIVAWMEHNLQEQISLTELPCQRCPYESMWIEAQTTTRDLVIVVRDIELDKAKVLLPSEFVDIALQPAKGVFVDGHSTVDVEAFTLFELHLADENEITGPIAWVLAALNKYGRMISNAFRVADGFNVTLSNRDESQTWILSSLAPAFWTLGFLHCRNVVVEEPVAVPAKVQAKRTKRLGHVPLGFSRLRIDIPGRKCSGSGTGVALGEQRFHIVGGHFAHYGNCCPDQHEPKGKLFGKYEGCYWMPMHARGNPEHGKSESIIDVRVADGVHIVKDEEKSFGLEIQARLDSDWT